MEVRRSPGRLQQLTKFFSGDLVGILKTLCLEKALEADQFFRFYTVSPRSKSRELRRTLFLDGRRIGESRLILPLGEDELLCPYFDPVSRTLRYCKRDGQDAPYWFDLSGLAQRDSYRPLMLMAHAEGLLDKLPGQQGDSRLHDQK